MLILRVCNYIERKRTELITIFSLLLERNKNLDKKIIFKKVDI